MSVQKLIDMTANMPALRKKGRKLRLNSAREIALLLDVLFVLIFMRSKYEIGFSDNTFL